MLTNTGPDNPDIPDPLERLLNQQVRLVPPPGTFELIIRRARRRKLRRAVAAVVSGVAVAAGAAVAAVNPTLLRLASPSESGQVASAGAPSPGNSTQPNGSGRLAQSPPAGSSSAGRQPYPGPVPAGFTPSSVTFISAARAWVIGQAGTPGTCYNGNICTSVAWTSDGGRTWHGQPAPVAGAPSGANGVSGIRFLNGTNGWAFGPELWATHDAGNQWRAIDTSGQRITDLEAAGNRAYALFANCSGTSPAGFAADCASYTLMTTRAGNDAWAPAGPATSNLAGGASASAMLALAGGTGYLLAPDGTLYSGPLGGTWSKTGPAPCHPSPSPRASGLPGTGQFAAVSARHLAMICGGPSAGGPPRVWTSADGGAHWTRRATAAWPTGTPASLAAAPDGELVLATVNGICVLPPGAADWRTATEPGGSALPGGGFSYVGMTSDSRGAALPANTSSHEIWVTTDGGRTWTPKPIA